MDWLARNGVRFAQAISPSPASDPAKASIYTGRRVFTHKLTVDGAPLPLNELTMADYFRSSHRTASIGRVNVKFDVETLSRFGIEPAHGLAPIQTWGSKKAAGFETYEPLEPEIPKKPYHGFLSQEADSQIGYSSWLRSIGYNQKTLEEFQSRDSWGDKALDTPSKIKESDSETAFIADRALDFIRESEGEPWFLHLSFSRPGEAMSAPAPYFALYADREVEPPLRDDSERHSSHPVYQALREVDESDPLFADERRARALTLHLGLIRQLDHHLGRVITFLKERLLLDETMIVLTSNHGRNFGDHWLTCHRLFHETTMRVPLLIVDPSEPARRRRKSIEIGQVEAIDIVPTLLDSAKIDVPDGILEGRSLLPYLHGSLEEDPERVCLSEADFRQSPIAGVFDGSIREKRAYMLRTKWWKYIHFPGFQPQLFDLTSDRSEFNDLGGDCGHSDVRQRFRKRLLEMLIQRA